MTNDNGKQASWWGDYSFSLDQIAKWSIGPLILWIQRSSQEWRVTYEHQDKSDPDETHTEVDLHVSPENISKEANVERYFFGRTNGILHIIPALADRPVVTRPVTPFHLPQGEEVTIFVSSPLWIRVEVNEKGQLLQEIPIYRPSDTWFGPSTREGELCYASQTHCRLSLDLLPLRPYRAITPVLVKNRGKISLLIERLSLPVVFLSLFSTPTGHFCTETVSMERKEEEKFATVHLGKGPPSQAEAPVFICGPRKKADKRVLIRALTSLFG